MREIEHIMPCLSCLVLPSHREGFGSVILEAAASNIPIISTNIPGPKDFINHLSNGYLVKAKDINALKESLDYIVENHEKANIFAVEAFKKCKKYYSEEFVSQLFVEELTKNL